MIAYFLLDVTALAFLANKRHQLTLVAQMLFKVSLSFELKFRVTDVRAVNAPSRALVNMRLIFSILYLLLAFFTAEHQLVQLFNHFAVGSTDGVLLSAVRTLTFLLFPFF